MSRSRNLKPGFFKNDRLAECDPLARILFQGLWCEADREGRLEDRPKKIKAECLPYDDCDVDELLRQLVGHGFIVRYVVDGVRFIAIPQFGKHQNPHVKEAASVIPAPDKPGASPVQATEIPERAGLIPDSLVLIPETRERPPGGKPPSAEAFEAFWTAYPNKKGRQEAEKLWKRRNLAELLPTLLTDVAARKRSDPDWLRGAIPHGKTYLSQSRWLDALVPDAAPTASGPASNPGGVSPRLSPEDEKRRQAEALAEMERQRRELGYVS